MSTFNRFRVCAAFWTMFAAASADAAEYTTHVSQSYSQRVQRVALAPVACPRDLDCPALEKALAERLADSQHTVIGAASTRDLMTRANVADLAQFEQRLILAEGLGVDAFVLVNILKAQVDASIPAYSSGSRFREKPGDKHAALEVRLLSRDGATLAQASGEAHVGGMRNLQSVTVELFKAVLTEVSKSQ